MQIKFWNSVIQLSSSALQQLVASTRGGPTGVAEAASVGKSTGAFTVFWVGVQLTKQLPATRTI